MGGDYEGHEYQVGIIGGPIAGWPPHRLWYRNRILALGLGGGHWGSNSNQRQSEEETKLAIGIKIREVKTVQ